MGKTIASEVGATSDARDPRSPPVRHPANHNPPDRPPQRPSSSMTPGGADVALVRIVLDRIDEMHGLQCTESNRRTTTSPHHGVQGRVAPP